MDELVNLVSKKTGLSKEQSKAAVVAVLDFLKKKLPGPAAAELDAVLGSRAIGAVANALEDGKLDSKDAANLLGGLLGEGKKGK